MLQANVSRILNMTTVWRTADSTAVDKQRGVCAAGYVLTNGTKGALACTPCSKRSEFCPHARLAGRPPSVGEGNYSVMKLVDGLVVAVDQVACEFGHFCRAGAEQECAVGSYQDERGKTSCKACTAPYFGNNTRLTSSACSGVCPPRHECVDGKLSGACDESLVVSDSARCTSCKANEFAFHSGVYPRWAAEIIGHDTCVECPHTPYGEAKCDGGLLEFSPGFWHSGIEWTDPDEKTSLKHVTKESLGWRPPGADAAGLPSVKIAFYPCPCKECCQVHARTGTVTCSPGNTGVLCAVCAPDHFKRTDTGRCVPCEDANTAQDVPWVPVLVLISFVLLFIGSEARAEWRLLRAVQKYIQGCRRLFVGKSKIVLSFFQIMLLTKNIYRVPFPAVFISFMDKLAFLRFELFKLVPVSCVVSYTFHDILDVVVVISFVLMLPPWFKLLQEYAGVCRPPRKWRPFLTGVVTWLLVITYLMYPTISSLLFQTFSCETVHLGSYLHQDLAIDCDGTAHQYYEGLSEAMIILFAFGVPLLFWALLRRHRRNLMHADAQYLSFFFADYTGEFWYWECVECGRKLALTGVALFFGEQGSLLQTAIAIGLLMLYIPILIKARPYVLPSDNNVAQLANVGLLFVLFSSMLLKVKTSFESTGRFALGYSEDTIGYLLIVVALVVVLLWSFTLVSDVRRFNRTDTFRFRSTGCLLTMPLLDGVTNVYHAFISHSQQDGGDQVAVMKKELEKHIGTINIFTDVAAGQRERALTEKSQLYSAIEQSEVFLVFLTRTFFTRKWCVKEFQEASARGKHIVLVLDTDPRHGGMTAARFVEYSTRQRQRAAADVESNASNLWNQATLDGDTACTALCEWVAEHVAVPAGESESDAGDRLLIRAFKYEAGDGEVVAVPERSYPVIPWYRYAAEKKVALQLIAEGMLAAPEWGLPPGKRALHLPMPRERIARTERFHLCLSAFNHGSAVIRRKLEAFEPKLRLHVPARGEGFAPRALEQCDAILVLNNRAPVQRGKRRATTNRVSDYELAGNERYQDDIRLAIDAGLRVILVHDCSIAFGALQSLL
eukprot:g5052.t1